MITQEHKKEIEAEVKSILKKYGVKGSLSRPNYHSLVLKIREGKIDFANCARSQRISDEIKTSMHDVNQYYVKECFNGKARQFLLEVIKAMNNGNYDKSRPEIDYFDVGWYITINIGSWDKPYKLQA